MKVFLALSIQLLLIPLLGAQPSQIFRTKYDDEYTLHEYHERVQSQLEMIGHTDCLLVDFSDVRKHLEEEGQSAVHYFLSSSTLTTYVFTPNDIFKLQQDRPPELLEDIIHLRKSIYTWPFTMQKDHLSIYYNTAYKLYNLLLAPVEEIIGERLVILVDGLLSSIPFDALLYQANDVTSNELSKYPFLIYKHQISFAYSLVDLASPKHFNKQADKQEILAYAPSFDGHSVMDVTARQRYLGPIAGNIPEVRAIARISPTSLRIGKKANVDNFLVEAEQYNIIHLATHAKANGIRGEYSFLAFANTKDSIEDELLYAACLTALPLRAEMVVLSACEGGIPNTEDDEKKITLAQAFHRAGAKSTLTTLWRIDDYSASVIMPSFYNNLKKGLPKDEALRNAKLAFLQEQKGPRVHPFYWSPFIFHGDMKAVKLEEKMYNKPWKSIMLGVILIILMIKFKS